jgi:hypothetical protein
VINATIPSGFFHHFRYRLTRFCVKIFHQVAACRRILTYLFYDSCDGDQTQAVSSFRKTGQLFCVNLFFRCSA